MINLEEAKDFITSRFNPETTTSQELEWIFEALEMAAKPDFKYPQKGEFPTNDRLLLFWTNEYRRIGHFKKGRFYSVLSDEWFDTSDVVKYFELPE